jgi:hypothetical protein
LVEDEVISEGKSVEALPGIYGAQVVNYLRRGEKREEWGMNHLEGTEGRG